MTFGFALKTLQQQSGLEFKLIIKTQPLLQNQTTIHEIKLSNTKKDMLNFA